MAVIGGIARRILCGADMDERLIPDDRTVCPLCEHFKAPFCRLAPWRHTPDPKRRIRKSECVRYWRGIRQRFELRAANR